MDDTDLLKLAGLSSSGVAIILVVYRVLKMMKGKKLVSSCCGRKLDFGVDVTAMTPQIVVTNPMPNRQDALEIKTPGS